MPRFYCHFIFDFCSEFPLFFFFRLNEIYDSFNYFVMQIYYYIRGVVSNHLKILISMSLNYRVKNREFSYNCNILGEINDMFVYLIKCLHKI